VTAEYNSLLDQYFITSHCLQYYLHCLSNTSFRTQHLLIRFFLYFDLIILFAYIKKNNSIKYKCHSSKKDCLKSKHDLNKVLETKNIHKLI